MTSAVTIGRASLILPLVGIMLSGISCRDDQSLGPTDSGHRSAGDPALAAATAAPLSFYQVSGGASHTCGVTMDNRLYCWGANGSGELGDGTTTDRLKPVPVNTTLRFREVSAGIGASCGITLTYQAYCWGYNGQGQLGDGTTETRLTPQAVAGGRQFRHVDMSAWHNCGVTYPDSKGYCWGLNGEGQLGDGTLIGRHVPVPVSGTLSFRLVSVGNSHTCGLTTDNRAFCWGANRGGQLGDRTEVRRRTKPALVADGHQFRQLDAGGDHTCGATTGMRAYCWGNGREGELGNGRAYLSFWPRPVAGGHSIERVTAGRFHSCGETTSNRAYCWGSNSMGQLGDGTGANGSNTKSLTPVAVAGGLFFSQLSAGEYHTCGRNDPGAAYCWGSNVFGSVGDGTTQNRSRPVAVAGPM